MIETAPTKRANHLRDLWLLTKIQVLSLREGWLWMVVMGPVFPLSVLAFLRFFAGGTTPERMTYIISGSIVYSLVLNTTLSMGQTIDYQKRHRHFDYYISLPVHKLSFLLAVLVNGLISAVPACLIVGAAGMLVFHLPLRPDVALIPFAALALASMCGFGALIGFLSPNERVANYGTQILAQVINFVSPTLVPMSSLPTPLQWLARVLPSTYVADGFRVLLTGGWTQAVTADALVLAAFSLLSVWLVLWGLDWRGRD